MPVNQIINPAESTENNLSGLFTAPFIVTGAVTKGDIVQLVTPYTTGSKPLKVKKATTTASNLIVGVATTTVASGTILQVTTYGPAQVLFKTDSVKADPVVQTGTNTGFGKTVAYTAATVGRILGVCLETVTSTTTHLVWVYVSRA